MKNLVKTVIFGVVIGASYQAGMDLWNNVLKEKVNNFTRRSGR